MRYILLILCFATSLAVAEETPDQAAIDFAQGLRDGLEKDKLISLCALNPDTGERKKDQIFAAWKSEAKKILPQAFEVVDRKIIGDNAAVILRQYDAKQSSISYLLSIAAVKNNQKWQAAPVMSSFQNSVVSYDGEILKQRRELEHWMMSREIFLREEMQNSAEQRMREMMEKRISSDTLKTIAPRELLDGLIAAVRDRDEPAVLARLGGYSSESVPEWSAIARRISAVISGDGLHKWPWKLLSSRQGLVAIGDPLDLGDEKVIDMLVIHPDAIMEEPDLLSFQIYYDADGRARVQLPEIFLLRNVAEEEMGDVMDPEDAVQLALYERLREQARKSYVTLDFTSASVLADVVVKSLQNNDFGAFWGAGALTARAVRMEEMPTLVGLWQSLQGSAEGSSLVGRVGFLEKEDYALLVLQTYTPRNVETIQLQKIWLHRKNQEWVLSPGEPEVPPEELTKWWDENRKTWAAKLSESLVVDAERIGALAPQHPEVAGVREVFTDWLQAVQDKSLAKVVRYCAAFQDKNSFDLMMRYLAGELMYGAGKYEVLDVQANGRWTVVSAKYLSDKPLSTPLYPLYVFVATDKGPRLLPQIELKLSLTGDRSRTFLNNRTFTELKKMVPDTAVAELQKLFDQHSELVKKQSVIK